MLATRFVACVFSIVLVGSAVVLAQDYPSKTIRIIGGAAGGGSDFAARLIAQGISGPLGQQVIMDNRTVIQAVEAVSKAPPDGYTVLVGGNSIWIPPLLQKVPYDMDRDFAPLLLISRDVNVVAVHPSVPAKSVKELVALAKSRPGELNYGSGSTGSLSHLAVELFKHMGGVNIARVPYKGTGPAITALLSGEVQLLVVDTGLLLPHAKSGRLRALAVTSSEPSAMAAGLPTVAASGLPGYEAVGMTGMFVPAKTPSAIINRLNQEMVRFLRVPEVNEKFLNIGAEVAASTPEQFAAAMKSDISRMARVIRDAGIKID